MCARAQDHLDDERRYSGASSITSSAKYCEAFSSLSEIVLASWDPSRVQLLGTTQPQ
jgi:hypothetical protein